MSGRGTSKSLKKYEKLLLLLSNGKPVTVQEIQSRLGSELEMYRLSNYIWNIKDKASGVVRAIRDGKHVTAYQLMNIEDTNLYLHKTNAYKKI